ncbi:MAG: hypothetical protein ACM3O6_15550 [Acidobacteriota bacterium]
MTNLRKFTLAVSALAVGVMGLAGMAQPAAALSPGDPNCLFKTGDFVLFVCPDGGIGGGELGNGILSPGPLPFNDIPVPKPKKKK